MRVRVVDGNLLEQDVEVIVNAWNRNVFPWWLLLPQGVSGAIKKQGGAQLFRELSGRGVLELGQAVLTGAGELPFRGIIHVAGIGLLWRASQRSIALSVRNAIELAEREAFGSIAFPLIGAGTGGVPAAQAESVMLATLASLQFTSRVTIVRYRRRS
ncbi:MAG: macro domain-containing protein [Myxococcota bacterium]